MIKIEEVKRERDGLLVLEDLERFSKEGVQALSEADVARLRWAGLFLRQTTPGHFMLRVRVPGGILEGKQVRVLGDLAKKYGRSLMDITTRQGVQMRWIRIEDVPEIFRSLSAVGLSPLQTGFDNVRNVMSCPVAGLDPREWIDVSEVVREVDGMIVGNREFSNLPRKFNISIVGCPDDCGHSEINDIGITPARMADGGIRFRVKVGGALGPTYNRTALPMSGVISRGEIAGVCRAILELYRDFGPRDKRHKARLFRLVDELGMQRFQAEVEGRSGIRFDTNAEGPIAEGHRHSLHRDHVGVHPERDISRAYVGLLVPVGSIPAQDWLNLGEISEDYGDGSFRLTSGQNIVLSGIRRTRIALMLREPALRKYTPFPQVFVRGTVSCTGKQFCDKAVIETKQLALATANALDANSAWTGSPLHIHWSGCPNSCGQHQVADIGLQGTKVRIDGKMAEAVDVYLGGRFTGASEPKLVLERVPASRIAEVLGGLIADLGERTGGGGKLAEGDFAAVPSQEMEEDIREAEEA